jgi:hypothetical protein
VCIYMWYLDFVHIYIYMRLCVCIYTYIWVRACIFHVCVCVYVFMYIVQQPLSSQRTALRSGWFGSSNSSSNCWNMRVMCMYIHTQTHTHIHATELHMVGLPRQVAESAAVCVYAHVYVHNWALDGRLSTSMGRRVCVCVYVCICISIYV